MRNFILDHSYNIWNRLPVSVGIKKAGKFSGFFMSISSFRL